MDGSIVSFQFETAYSVSYSRMSDRSVISSIMPMMMDGLPLVPRARGNQSGAYDFAVFAKISLFQLKARALARCHLPVEAHLVLHVIRMGELGKSHTRKLFAAVAEQLLHGRIAEQDPAFLEIYQRYANCRSLKDCSKLFLTFPEGILSTLLVGDVEQGYEVLLVVGCEGDYGGNLFCSSILPDPRKLVLSD